MTIHVEPPHAPAQPVREVPPVAPPPPRPKSGGSSGPSVLARVGGPLRTGGWPFAVVIAILMVLAGAIGTVSGNTRAEEAEADAVAAWETADQARAERRESRGELATASATIEDLEGEVERLEGSVERARADATRADDEARAKAEAEFAERQAALDARSAELDQRSAGLDARDAAITQTEQRIEQNSFGNGVWEVGVDIQPGKYKTAGSADCYWKKGDPTGEIIDNEIVHGPATVIIEPSVFTFTSNRCGTWTLVP